MPFAALAFIVFDTDQVARFFLNLLAVAGGFLLGYALTGVAVWAIDRWFTGGKMPIGVYRVARMIGGIALAVLVALLLFGGGFGPGTGPGAGPGDTTETGPGAPQQSPPTTQIEPTPPPVLPKDAPLPEERVRVTLLGGEAVKEERFYLIDYDPAPKTFAEVVAAVNARKAEVMKPVGVEIRFTADNTLAQNHAAVLQVINWARANDVAVTLLAKP
jgi:hypothetical protein